VRDFDKTQSLAAASFISASQCCKKIIGLLIYFDYGLVHSKTIKNSFLGM